MNKFPRFFAATVLGAACLWSGIASAAPPVVGPNVNMVSGTKFPEGDPFLTKQNEPSVAVSSRNPRHLLAASNDYRQVAVLTAEGLRGGKAWNTLYKSVDGGSTWRSVVLGGCPIDIPACNDPTGLTAPLRAFKPDFSADPTVRPGPYGTFFYSFIAGRRDGSADGVVAVQRFVDKNNDIQRNTDLRSCELTTPGCVAVTIPDGCTPGPANPGCTVKNVLLKPAEDPIVPDVVAIVAKGSGGKFVDKPWNAADIPRSWNAGKSCNLLEWTSNKPGVVTNASENVPAFNVYASFANFAGKAADNEHPTIYVVVSTDCGKTFGNPIKISNPLKANSGTNIAIDPLTGAVYVVWRNFDGPDAIYMAKSTDGGKTWSKKPILVANFNAYDQGTSGASFRTLAFPSMAISVKGNQSRLHVAWTQRKAKAAATPPYACQSNIAAECDTRVVISTSTDGGNTWSSPPKEVDPPPTPPAVDLNNPANPTGRGHQFQPALTFAAGKLALTWLDQRLDHTEGVLRCPPGKTCKSVNDLREVREPKGNLAPGCSVDLSKPDYRTPAFLALPQATRDALASCRGPGMTSASEAVWTTYITDGTPGLVRRHTLDTYAAMADPEFLNFSSTRVSQYVFGSTVAGTFNSEGKLVPERGTYDIRQKEVNPPNLPMFVNGGAAFIGDYIDIAGQLIVATGDPTRPYKYNVGGGGGANGNFTTGDLAPLFHVTFTDNRDVIPPLSGDWSTPTCLAAGLAEDGSGKVTGANNFKGCATPGYAGNRNQNVYSAIVAESSLAFANANSKLLNPTTPRGFVVTVQNVSDVEHTYTLTLPSQPPVVAAFNKESFAPGTETPKTTLDVVVQPRSSSTRTVWATSIPPVGATTPPAAMAKVLVNVSSAGAGFATQLVLNADPGGVFVTNGDGAAADLFSDDLGNVVLSNAVLTNNALSNNALTNNVLTNAALTNAVLSNVVLSNAVLSNFQVENLSPGNAALTNNVLTNNVLSNVVLTNAVLSNAALSNAVLSNVVLSNSAMNVALTNIDPANVALSNAVLSNNALTNVVLSNDPEANALSNAMLSNAVLSNAALSNVVLSNAALSNAVLSNNALTNVALTNAPLSDPSNGTNPDADPLRAIEPASIEVANNEFETGDLSKSNFRETSFTIRNHGNTDATLAVKLMLRDAVCTPKPDYPQGITDGSGQYTCTTPGYKLQLILRKVTFIPSAIAPTGPATDFGHAYRVGLVQRNTEVSNVGDLPIISPDDPNLGKFLADDPRAATLPLGAGEWAHATIRAIAVCPVTQPNCDPPPDPADLLRWGVKAVAANASNTGNSFFIRTLSFPVNSVTALQDPNLLVRTIGGTGSVSGTAVCTDNDGTPVSIADPQISTVNPPAGYLAKALVPCAQADITVSDDLTATRTAKLSFTPQYWGEFYTVVNLQDGSATPQTDRQVIKVVVKPATPAVTFTGFPTQITYQQTLDLSTLVAPAGSVITSTSPVPFTFAAALSATNACYVDPDGHTLRVDRSLLGIGNPPNCVISVSQMGNETYAPITVPSPVITVNQADQEIGFTYLPANDELQYRNGAVTLVANGTSPTAPASGIPVTFVSTSAACTTSGTSGTTLTIAGAGTCALTVDQAGSANYKPAPTLSPSFSIRKASQNIALVAPSTAPYNASFAVSATSTSPSAPPSNLQITFGSSTPAVCTISGSSVSILAIGTCTISADQPGNPNYDAAPQVTRNITITKADQNIVFGAAPVGVTFGDAPVSVNATSTSPTAPPSGTPITFGSLTSTVCTTTTGGTVTIVGAGTCTIAADQAGSDNYNAAPQVTQEFGIAKAPVQFTVDPLYFTSLDSATMVTGKLHRPGFPAVYPPDAPTIAVQANATTLTSSAPGVPGGAFTASGASPPSGSYTLTFTYAESANFLTATATAKLHVEGFSAAGNMTEARARHRSILLDDGRVLIAGGFAGNFIRSATAEVYCPDTMSPPPPNVQCPGVGFYPVGSLHAGSDGHTLTKLLDGRVLKVGGRNTKVEIFDPATNLWTDVATAALPIARTFHQATLLTCTGPGCTYNGKVLITGGDDNTAPGNAIQNTLATTLIFDPATNLLSAGPTMSAARDSHSATALADGRVLIAGGEWRDTVAPNAVVALNSVEIYDPSLDSSTCAPSTLGCMVTAPSMTDARFSDGSTLLADGRVLIAGGSNDTTSQRSGILASAEIYDPVLNTWTLLQPPVGNGLQESRRAYTLTRLYDDWVLAAGGFGPLSPDDVPRRSSSELFDPSLDQFDLGASMSTARARHRATRLLDGRVLITGGTIQTGTGATPVERDTAINSAEFYNGPPPDGLPAPDLLLNADPGGDAYTLFTVEVTPGVEASASITPSGHGGNGFLLPPFEDLNPNGTRNTAVADKGPYVVAGDLAAQSALTIAAWIRPDALAKEQFIASKYESPDANISWFVSVGGPPAYSDGLRAGVGGVGATARGFTAAYPVAAGEWAHVAFVYSVATQVGTFYVNGVAQPTTPSGDPLTAIRQNGTPVRLGVYFAGGGYTGPAGYFAGSIDSVRGYVTALTPAQIALLAAMP